MKIPVFDLELYLKATGAGMACPFCRCEDWNVEAETDGNEPSYFVIADIATQEQNRHITSTRSAIIATCTQCSFMRFMDAMAIAAWREQMPS